MITIIAHMMGAAISAPKIALTHSILFILDILHVELITLPVLLHQANYLIRYLLVSYESAECQHSPAMLTPHHRKPDVQEAEHGLYLNKLNWKPS
jgi:hypothetical protein